MNLKERIIQTSSELFCENGIKSITMDMIAETLGISKRTLYENFTDKNDLVNDCFSYALKCSEEKSGEIHAVSSNTIEAFLKFYLTGMEEMRKCNKNYITDIRKYHPQVFERVKRHREQIFKEDIVVALDKGILDGLVRPDVNTEIIAIMIKEQLYIIESEIPDLKKFDLFEIYETLFMNFMRGIATTDGLKVIDELMEKSSKSTNKKAKETSRYLI